MPVCGWRESSATARTATTGPGRPARASALRDAVAQIVDVQAVVGQHVEVDAAGGLAHLVVEHLRRADEHRPDDERVHLDVVPAQDVVRTALHADAQQAVVGDDGEAVVQLVADERLDAVLEVRDEDPVVEHLDDAGVLREDDHVVVGRARSREALCGRVGVDDRRTEPVADGAPAAPA